MTRVQLSQRGLDEARADVRIALIAEGENAARLLPGKAGRRLSSALERRRFKGGVGETALIELGDEPQVFVVTGLGPAAELTAEGLHRAAASAMRAAQRLEARSVAARLPPVAMKKSVLGAGRTAQCVAEGLLLGSYRFERYKTDRKAHARVPLRIQLLSDKSSAAIKEGVRRARAVASASAEVRDLVNEPAAALYPASYTTRVRRLFRGSGVQVRVLRGAQLDKQRMGALLQVAAGSERPPAVLHLVSRPARRSKRKVALVGKGVTFDAGGYNLKGTGHIETMKMDMAGSAAVVGALLAAADLGLPIELHGVIGLVENLVSGKAYKPGDVLQTRAGKTVEVDNTDAEGRLVLADLLDYTRSEIRPDVTIDLATLTGACVVALGEKCSGVMSNDDELREEIVSCAGSAGEKMWPLPLFADYFELLKSSVADFKNTGSRWGGALTAGLFLQQFAGEGPWAHLDIAGPAFSSKDDPFWGVGGTAAGVATLVEYLAGEAG